MTSIPFCIAVEGVLDEVVLSKILESCGHGVNAVFGKEGKGQLRTRIAGYNKAAQYYPWIVLVDLNSEFDCPPLLKSSWLPESSRFMCFRVCVHEVEAWILADRAALAKYLSIKPNLPPNNPESEADPKGTIVRLARRSVKRKIREGIVPRPGSHRELGPAYISLMSEFVQTLWSPERARLLSPSLDRCIKAITSFRYSAEGMTDR